VVDRAERDLAAFDGGVQGAAGGGVDAGDPLRADRPRGPGARGQQAPEHLGGLVGLPAELADRLVKVLEVAVAQVDQADVAEAGFEVECDVFDAGGADGCLEGSLADEPLVEVVAEGQGAVDVDGRGGA
jgi:hypothetical protein